MTDICGKPASIGRKCGRVDKKTGTNTCEIDPQSYWGSWDTDEKLYNGKLQCQSNKEITYLGVSP